MKTSNTTNRILTGIVLGISTVFLGVLAIYWTYVPYLQMRTLYKKLDVAFANGKNEVFTDAKFVFSPWTYAQGLIRYDVVDLMLTQYKLGKLKTDHPIFTLGLQKLEEYVDREPNFLNYYFILGRAYDKLADIHNNNMTELKKAEEFYKKGLALNPYRQDGRYAYAINLMNQGREAESLDLIHETLNQNNSLAETYYYAGVLEMRAQKPDYSTALFDMEKGLSGGVNADPRATSRIYQILFNTFYQAKDVQRFSTVITRRMELDSQQKATYEAILEYIKAHNAIPIIDIVPQKK